MPQKIIGRGAEAILIQKGSSLVKERIEKGYRLAVIDNKLRKSRTKREAKLLEKASSLISVPIVLDTNNKNKIKMQFIKGKKLSDWLDKFPKAEQVCEQIGSSVSILHDNDIIHGDLTTSNMILAENNLLSNKPKPNNNKLLINDKSNNINKQKVSKNNFKVFFIDFGLGFHSKRMEDKAVDLHLIRQALEAKHFLHWKKFFSSVLKGYKSENKPAVLQQLKKVESRGRYKKSL